MYGLDSLGVDEAKPEDKNLTTAEKVAKYGPDWIQSIASAARGPQTPTTTPLAAQPTATWVYPVVALAGLALVGGIIFGVVKK